MSNYLVVCIYPNWKIFVDKVAYDIARNLKNIFGDQGAKEKNFKGVFGFLIAK